MLAEDSAVCAAIGAELWGQGHGAMCHLTQHVEGRRGFGGA